MAYIDVNAYVGCWPYRTVPEVSAQSLLSALRAEGITGAYVSSIQAIFHEDPSRANERLTDETSGLENLAAVPVINLRLYGFGRLITGYADGAMLPAVKIHPNFHGYSMKDTCMEILARRLIELNRPLLVPVRMEDERFQNPRMQVPPVPVESIVSFALEYPDLNIICLNAYRREVLAAVDPPNLSFDIAFVDGWKPVDDLNSRLPPKRILFGSHTPLFVTRAACMKLENSDVAEQARHTIGRGNAERYIGTFP